MRERETLFGQPHLLVVDEEERLAAPVIEARDDNRPALPRPELVERTLFFVSPLRSLNQ